MTGSLHVVVGASGGTGGALVWELDRRGHRVRAVNRRGDAPVPAGVERLAADVATVDGAKAAADGAAVVYHCAQPPYTDWPAAFPPLELCRCGRVQAAGTSTKSHSERRPFSTPNRRRLTGFELNWSSSRLRQLMRRRECSGLR